MDKIIPLNEIFKERLFRIPDYQRGFSWEKKQLEEFWQDLENLQEDHIHYTGMISVEKVPEDAYKRWEEDLWIINRKKYKPFFIVDGQQRLTTIAILIWSILERFDDKTDLIDKFHYWEKYIINEDLRREEKSYIFGYEVDNPSFNFLKKEIFGQEIDPSEKIINTSYTNNLFEAKKFFLGKLRNWKAGALKKLLDKVTEKLKFDYKEIDKELDIFVVFETMNNRGKPLSNLEKLKNRLIYLSTLLKTDDKRKQKLRNEINESWRIIYEYLGRNKDNRMDDDSFLMNHWIMYGRYERREQEFYAKDLFDRKFTVKNTVRPNVKATDKVTYEEIERYILSIRDSAKEWFVINNPMHEHALELQPNREIAQWLVKVNRLGFRSFAPIILGAFVKGEPDETKVELLRAIEAYIFLVFCISNRRSNTGTYHFYARASELYRGDIRYKDIIKDINFWTYGDDFGGYYDIDNFYKYLKDLFQMDSKDGYRSWKWLKYFLHEYEEYISVEGQSKVSWEKTKNIENIYPGNAYKSHWKKHFSNLNGRQRNYFANTLGNILLTSKKVDEARLDMSFKGRKKEYYQSGSASERQMTKYDEWTPDTIKERGLKMISFFEKRWNVTIEGGIDYKLMLLFLDFME